MMMFTDACVELRHAIMAAESDVERGRAVAKFRHAIETFPRTTFPLYAECRVIYDTQFQRLKDACDGGFGEKVADDAGLKGLLRLVEIVRRTLDAPPWGEVNAATNVARARAMLAATSKRTKVLNRRHDDLGVQREEVQSRLSAIDLEMDATIKEIGDVFVGAVKTARGAGIEVNVPEGQDATP